MKTKTILALGLLTFLVLIFPSALKAANLDTIKRDVESFIMLQLDGGYEVILIQDSQEKVIIVSERSNSNEIKTEIEGNKLHIYTRGTFQFDKIKLIIFYKSLEKIDINGGVTLETKNTLNTNNLQLNVAGGATIEMNIHTSEFKADLSGGTMIQLSGDATNVDINLNGAGKVDADNLKTESTKIDISGAGTASVNASKMIDANISGVGSISYTGNPDKVKSNISGVGSIKEK